MKKNDIIELTIEDITREGMGVGRAEDGMAVFVRSAAVGDRLRARIINVRRSYAIAIVDELTVPSPARAEPLCPVSGRCGGCAFWHIDYGEELRVKRRWVEDALVRIGGLALPVDEVEPSECARYRNKAQFPIGRDGRGRVVTGFFRRGTHDIAPVEDCLIGATCAAGVLRVVRSYAELRAVPTYDEATGHGLLRHVCLRTSRSGEAVVVLVATSDALPYADELVEALKSAAPGLVGVVLSVNAERTNVVLGRRMVTLWGREWVEETLCGVSFRIGPRSFFQVNPAQAERLYEHVRGLCALTGDQTLLDLYCGVGAMGLICSGGAKRVIGVENVPEAIADARECARRNGITNTEFMCCDAGEAAEALLRDGARPDAVLLDPPRKGCGAPVLDAVLALAPRRVVYVSCDPATLARDLRALCGGGYAAQSCKPYDMFPRTGHVETVVLLQRQDT